MEKLKQYRCLNCTAVIEYDGVSRNVRCKYCRTPIIIEDDKYDLPKLQEASELRNKLDLEGADEILTEIINENRDCGPEPYFQRILVTYGVTYVDENNNHQYKPTLSCVSPMKVSDHQDYKKVLDQCSSDEKEEYQRKLDELETLRSNVMEEVEKQNSFDIFICYKKTSDSGDQTYDSKTARDIYDLLIQKGKKVFFAEKTLTGCAGQEYEPIIYSALTSAKVMIVVAASKKEYIESPWVKNEWKRFNNIVQNSGNTKIIIPIFDHGFEPSNLPKALSKYQGLTMGVDFNDQLLSSINKFCTSMPTAKIRKKQGPAEIKPIEVEQVAINKREIKSNGNFEMSLSDQTVLKFISETINGKAQDKFDRVIEICNRNIQKSPENPEFYWWKGLAVIKCDNTKNFSDCFFRCYNFKRALFCEAMDKCLTYCDDQSRKNRLEILKQTLINYMTNGSFILNSYDLYSIIIPYLSEEEETILTKQVLDLFLVNLKNNMDYTNKDIVDFVEIIYPYLSRQGVQCILNVYECLSDFFMRRGDFEFAKYYNDKILKLFEVDPAALWGNILCTNKCKNAKELGAKFNDHISAAIYEALSKMLKGGLDINDYFKKAFEYCVCVLDKNLEKGIAFFKNIYELIPEDNIYKNTQEKIAIEYSDLLCAKGEFDTARDFYNDVVASNPQNPYAHFGLLKCAAKARTILDLLLVPKHFDVLYGNEFWNLKEALSQCNDNSFIKMFEVFSKIHEDILNKSKNIKNIIYKEINKASDLIEKNHFVITQESLVEITKQWSITFQPGDLCERVYERCAEKQYKHKKKTIVKSKNRKNRIFESFVARIFKFSIAKNVIMALTPLLMHVALCIIFNHAYEATSLDQVWNAYNQSFILGVNLVLGSIAVILIVLNLDTKLFIKIISIIVILPFLYFIPWALVGTIGSIIFNLTGIVYGNYMVIIFAIIGALPYIIYKLFEFFLDAKDCADTAYVLTTILCTLLVLVLCSIPILGFIILPLGAY